MRITPLAYPALLVLALGVSSLPLTACDDGEALPPDMSFPDSGPPPVGRDMRSEAGPVDMGPAAAPDIDIMPSLVQLVAASGERSAPGVVSVANAGDAPLTITAVSFDGDAGFEVDPIEGLPRAIEPGEVLEVEVFFAPDAPGEREASLVITSDDPDEARREIRVTGRNPEACIRAMPRTVDLGSVAVGQDSGRGRVQIINCGDLAATIGEIALDGPEGFSWEVTQGMGAGQLLLPGSLMILEVGYSNGALADDERASATLVVPTDLPAGDLRIELLVRGGGGPTCELVIEPEMVDYETLRVGATRPLPLTVINRGTAHCELRGLAAERTDGAEENGFVIVQGLEGDRMEGGAEQVIEVAYAPVVPDPIGDRAELRLTFHDPHRGQNRTARAMLRGVGAEALIGADPEAVDAGVTTIGCVSWRRAVDVANVGFVPICVSGFHYEGEACDRFVAVSEPSVPDGDCIPLERGEAVAFEFRYQPGEAGDERCTLIVESDAQNDAAIEVPMVGTGTDTAETVDTFEVGDLNGRRDAFFGLSRPCTEATLRVFVNDEETRAFDFSVQRNALVFEANAHPASEGDALRVEYDARCFQLGD